MLYFIINPSSSSGKGMAIWKKCSAILDEQHVTYHPYFLQGPGDAERIAQKMPSHAPCTVVIVGGDGTINEFLTALPSFEGITFACLPTGSANDFARGMDLGKWTENLLRRILDGSNVHMIDVGITTSMMNGHSTGARASEANVGNAARSSETGVGNAARSSDANAENTVRSSDANAGNAARSFAVSSGIGFDAAVCHAAEAGEGLAKKLLNTFHLGKLIYLVNALRMLYSMKLFRMKIRFRDPRVLSSAEVSGVSSTQVSGVSSAQASGGFSAEASGVSSAQASGVSATPEEGSSAGVLTLSFDKVCFAAAMNTRFEGGGFMFAPEADPSDAALDVIIAEGLPKWKILLLLPTAFSGNHVKHKGIHLIRCSSAELLCDSPQCVHTDGEHLGYSRAIRFETRPEKLRVIL